MIGFFEESKNVRSWTRLIATIPIVCGCIIAFLEVTYCLIWNSTYDIYVGLIDSLILSGFGAKVTQKIWGEKNTQNNDNSGENNGSMGEAS